MDNTEEGYVLQTIKGESKTFDRYNLHKYAGANKKTFVFEMWGF